MEEVVYNRFVRVLGEWICIHDEELHFSPVLYPPHRPAIKLCGSTLRVRANDAFTKLPNHLREAMVAHELGHREMNHASIPQDNPFYRLGFILHKDTVDPKELEADRYACKLLTREKYIAALKEIRQLYKSDYDVNWATVKEYDRRIKELEVTFN